jgi:hypothetical protein
MDNQWRTRLNIPRTQICRPRWALLRFMGGTTQQAPHLFTLLTFTRVALQVRPTTIKNLTRAETDIPALRPSTLVTSSKTCMTNLGRIRAKSLPKITQQWFNLNAWHLIPINVLMFFLQCIVSSFITHFSCLMSSCIMTMFLQVESYTIEP